MPEPPGDSKCLSVDIKDHDDWVGTVGRLRQDDLAAAVWEPSREPIVYVCGPTGFVEHVADALVRIGHPPARIRTERFGGA